MPPWGNFKQAFELDPTNATALCEMAQVLKAAGSLNRAYEIYQQLMTLEPDNADHFFKAGMALKRCAIIWMRWPSPTSRQARSQEHRSPTPSAPPWPPSNLEGKS